MNLPSQGAGGGFRYAAGFARSGMVFALVGDGVKRFDAEAGRGRPNDDRRAVVTDAYDRPAKLIRVLGG